MKIDEEFPLIAAVLTPFAPDGSLLPDAVDDHARWLHRMGVSSAFVGGSTGECASLTVSERKILTEHWTAAAKIYELEVIVQVGSTSLAECCQLAEHAYESGAHAVSLLPPYYFRPPDVASLVDFCAPVANSCGGLPFYYYHVPDATKVYLSMPEFLKQASGVISNLAGIKFSDIDPVQLQHCIRFEGGRYDIYYGQDQSILAAYAFGAAGVIGSTYNLVAPLFRQVIEAAAEGDLPRARELQAEGLDIVEKLMRFGYLASAKSVLDVLGVRCGPVRAPLRNLTSEEKHEVITSLQECLAVHELLL